MPKKATKKEEDFDFQKWITNEIHNKYLKIGFINTINKIPKSEAEAKKLLNKYLGE